jgi:N-acetylglutamate synthase-like GNAT family acetyltransferase
MLVTVRTARPADFNRIVAAYRNWSYLGGIEPDDTVWVAEREGELIGVVRIAPENGTLVLRGMRIAEPWRRHGIGSQMLRAIAAWLGDRECYCISYDHLVHYYGQIGFVEVASANAPAFLAERLIDYQRRALNVTIMTRPAR